MKLSRLLALLRNLTISFRKPARTPILVYDRDGSEVLSQRLPAGKTAVLDVRKESLNIPVFLRMLLKGQISYRSYIDQYILAVSPDCLVTFIDNNSDFYRIKQRFPAMATVFVQNGTRGEIGDVFGNTTPDPHFQVDHMLVHGDAVGRKYESWIRGNSLTIGSFKNNEIEYESRSRGRRPGILFISTFLVPPVVRTEPLWIENDGKITYWDDFYYAESVILPFLKDYSIRNNIPVQVCGRLQEGHDTEEAYYGTFLNGCNWEFLRRAGKYSSYQYIDESSMVVNIDSTLGYEALARGCRVAFFSIREGSLKSIAARFGWPAELPARGPFWINEESPEGFEEILDSVLAMSDAQWDEARKRVIPEVIDFDPANRRFSRLIESILQSSQSPWQTKT